MKRTFQAFVLLLFLNPFVLKSFAQTTMIYEDPQATFNKALELYQTGKYAWARELFLSLSEINPEPRDLLKEKAEYYAAICGVELMNNNTDQVIMKFLDVHEVSCLVPQASLQLAKLEYRKGNYQKAIQYFSKMDRKNMHRDERDEYNFKMGYSFLRINKNGQAAQFLNQIKDPESIYASPTEYYLGHINYLNKEYDQALQHFKNLSTDPTFQSIVPYYITQIYFLRKDYDKLLEKAPQLLSNSNVKRAPEIARMIGESYYNTQKYAEAIPYLEQYLEKSKLAASREDHYQLAMACYQTGKYEQATPHFRTVAITMDTLGQNASYHLGDCLLRLNQRKTALQAFYAACKEGPDARIREDALFSYAKLSYELGYNPYNEAINALRQYISQYPDSPRIDEANTYLVGLYMSTNSYKDALETLENIKNKTQQLRDAYQRLHFYRGIEEFNASAFSSAQEHFKMAESASTDKSIVSESIFWGAEAMYRQGNYQDAAQQYARFILTPGAYSSKLYPLASYNAAYCYFKQKEYGKALLEFRKTLASKDKLESRVLNDAYMRSGDCYFATKDYDEAENAYDNAFKMKKGDADYALFQKAMAQGAAAKLQAKASTLKELINTYPKSSLLPGARFELGLNYLQLDDESLALQAFDELVKKHPADYRVKDALLRMGLIYFNRDENEKALRTFKKVVADYPATPESNEALVGIQNIYVELNKVGEFFHYTDSIPNAKITNAKQDSLTYLAAETRYLNGDCNSSTQGFKDYLNNFPRGIFKTNAQFYLADCMFRQNKPGQALTYYLLVIEAPNSRFTETSLANISIIYFSEKDYATALKYFLQLKGTATNSNNLLDALTGIMRCQSELKNHKEAIAAADALMENPNVSEELAAEAHLVKARAAFASDQVSMAQKEFEVTYKTSKNEKGAEAKYHLAQIQYNQNSFKEAEKTIFEYINEFSSYDYWLARSFILLADVYVKLDNSFQAKQTLQSIIDNYEGDDLVALAREKLTSIEKAEKERELKRQDEARKAAEEQIKKEQEDLIENK